MTPVNLVSKTLTHHGKRAKIDYKREKDFEENGHNVKWDDSKYNNAVVGDYFAFVHNIQDRAEIYRIERISLAETRPNYWDLPNHQRRNVLYFSSMIKEIPWHELKNLLGYNETYYLQGTTRSKKNILIQE